MNIQVQTRDIAVPKSWDRRGLPAWTYHSEGLLELEKEYLFRTHWQVAGHVADIPRPGDYLTLDLAGERALVVRGSDGVVRGFHNICRHRGSRVVADERGHCRNALVCPFHGWVYNLDGTLRGAARPRSFPELDKAGFGLKPLDLEVWMGLVFIRFSPGPQPAVADMFRPFEAEIAHYRIGAMVPTQDNWKHVVPVNWKSVRDVDNEGYHVAMAHPALQDLYGQTYIDEPFVNGVNRTIGIYNADPGRRWSVRMYRRIAPKVPHLPDHLNSRWFYYGLFPNTVIQLTPQTMQFYQELPLSPRKTVIRGSVYAQPDEPRAQRLARYLCARIDRETIGEDMQLTIWSNESMMSNHFEGFFLSDLEYCVRTHHDHLRQVLPVLRLEDQPEEKDLWALNEAMRAR
jgi:phenylpropionate dioxygenase-like ring-hydroxylating dioxygenase large terminal subunit